MRLPIIYVICTRLKTTGEIPFIISTNIQCKIKDIYISADKECTQKKAVVQVVNGLVAIVIFTILDKTQLVLILDGCSKTYVFCLDYPNSLGSDE